MDISVIKVPKDERQLMNKNRSKSTIEEDNSPSKSARDAGDYS